MSSILSLEERIHADALAVSAQYKKSESDLIDILQTLEAHLVFLKRGYASLSSYVVAEMGIAENTTYVLITIARKAREVPKLKERIRAGAVNISNARRIVSVLTAENQDEWLSKAEELSARQLEKEVVRVRPEEAVRERASYITPDRIRLEVGLSEEQMLRLSRVQDLMSQSKRRHVSLEETISVLTEGYLDRHDPLEKAKRNARKGTGPVGELVTGRTPIPAAILHEVALRDQRRCTFILPNGSRCNQARWIEIHHQVPVNEGGKNVAENLTTLCSAHHKRIHWSGSV